MQKTTLLESRGKRSALSGALKLLALTVAVSAAAGCAGQATPADTEASSALAMVGPDYVLGPHAGIHKSCVYNLKQGDSVDEAGAIHSTDGHVQTVPPCAHPSKQTSMTQAVPSRGHVQAPTDNGWTESAYWVSPVAMRDFGTTFHVPAAPSIYTNQLIYMFPAMVDGTGHNIIQPVLQYGYNQSFGGNYWSLAGWFGGDNWGGNYYHSDWRVVTTGEEIRGGIWADTNDCNASGCMWYVGANDTNNSSYLQISTRTTLAWTIVYGGTLEAYGVDDCRKYPATWDNFYDFFLEDFHLGNPTPSWTPWILVNTCGESVTSQSSFVNLYY
jgi:hypothetical protein